MEKKNKVKCKTKFLKFQNECITGFIYLHSYLYIYIFTLSMIEISKSLISRTFLMLKKSFELTGLHYSSRGLHKKQKKNGHTYPKT